MIELVFITYNRLYYTRLALASILADPAEVFSLTIWDNASTDGTIDYLKNHVNDHRIKDIIFSKENLGQITAVNTVWSNSRADLLGKLDNDCLVTPGWTRKLARAHEDIDKLGVIACWHYFEDDFDYQRAGHKIQTFSCHQILRHPWTCGTGLLIKRDIFKKFGPIQSKATSKYWLKIASKGYINGFYYPFIYQEHMDDPKSEYTKLKDEQSYQQARKVTFNINYHGQETLRDRWLWRKKVLDNLLDDPWHAKYYLGWRRKLRSIKMRLVSLPNKKQTQDQIQVTSNNYRLAQFRTGTVVAQRENRKVLCKYAMTTEAKNFIKLIARREKNTAACLGEQFDVLCGTLKNSHIEYDYLGFPSLADKIKSYMQHSDLTAANGLVGRYIEKIKALKTIQTVPVKFLKNIANDDRWNCEIACLYRGLLDLTPKNILVDNSRWIVIDNEWSFDFPIPVAFLLLRAIRELSIELQKQIRNCTSRDNPAINLFVTSSQTYYTPSVWAKYLNNSEIDLNRMLDWELGFRRYVAGPEIKTVGKVNTDLKERYHFLVSVSINYPRILKK
jgi:glycosyltransferase involved in cell wall biosynthesis